LSGDIGGLRVEQGTAGLTSQAMGNQLVNVKRTTAGDHEADSTSVLRDNRFANLTSSREYLVTAVLLVIVVRVTAQKVRFWLSSPSAIDGLSERQFETVWNRSHLLNLERDFSRPDQSLQTVGRMAERAPTPVRQPREQAAILAEFQANHGRGETFAKGKAGTLIDSVHLFQEDSVDGRKGKLTHEQLFREGPECSSRLSHTISVADCPAFL
jgi:hypothetical protein